MVRPAVAPWQVWWTNFDPQIGREQAGRRPAIIVGTALACALPNGLVIVIPMTSTDRGLPFHPMVSLGEKRCAAMTDQIKSISTDRLVAPHKRSLTDDDIETIKFAMRQMIDVT